MRDIPPLTTVLVPSQHGVGPYHIKGIGESPLTPVAPAIANAIADAVGGRLRDLPLTAEKVYCALQSQAKRSSSHLRVSGINRAWVMATACACWHCGWTETS